MRDRDGLTAMARSPKPDTVALVAGLALTALGTVLLLDQLDVFKLTFAAAGPLVCAVLGTILLAAGLSRRA